MPSALTEWSTKECGSSEEWEREMEKVLDCTWLEMHKPDWEERLPHLEEQRRKEARQRHPGQQESFAEWRIRQEKQQRISEKQHKRDMEQRRVEEALRKKYDELRKKEDELRIRSEELRRKEEELSRREEALSRREEVQRRKEEGKRRKKEERRKKVQEQERQADGVVRELQHRQRVDELRTAQEIQAIVREDKLVDNRHSRATSGHITLVGTTRPPSQQLPENPTTSQGTMEPDAEPPPSQELDSKAAGGGRRFMRNPATKYHVSFGVSTVGSSSDTRFTGGGRRYQTTQSKRSAKMIGDANLAQLGI